MPDKTKRMVVLVGGPLDGWSVALDIAEKGNTTIIKNAGQSYNYKVVQAIETENLCGPKRWRELWYATYEGRDLSRDEFEDLCEIMKTRLWKSGDPPP